MKRHIGRLVRVTALVVIVAAVGAFALTVDWRETWVAIRAASPELLAAAALANVLSLGLKGVRWWIFLRPIGVSSLWLAMRGTFVAAGFNNVLIANSGDAARVIFVARAARVPSERVLATLALERLFEIVGFVVLLAVAVTFLGLPAELESARPLALVALVAMIGLLVFLVLHPERAELPPLEGEGLFVRARAYGRGFYRTLTGISTGPRFGFSLVLTAGVWVLQLASYALTAIAARFDLSLVGTIAVVLAVNIGFAIRATPGNVGVFQMVYAVTAASFGMDKDQATGVAFLIQAQQLLPVTILGLLAAPELLFARGRTAASTSHVGR